MSTPTDLAAIIPDAERIKGHLAKNLAERRLLQRQYRLAVDREREANRLRETYSESTNGQHQLAPTG